MNAIYQKINESQRRLDRKSELLRLGYPPAAVAAIVGWPDIASAIDLSHTGVTDLSPLAGMESLRSLQLSCCARLQDLSPLADAPLEWLDLSGCPNVSDLTPLKGMRSLKRLDLSGTAVSDLSPLRAVAEAVRPDAPTRPLPQPEPDPANRQDLAG